LANRWHATENLAGFLAACDPPMQGLYVNASQGHQEVA
jgi:hypothetical protein